MTTRGPRAGFTLLEVMFATAIFSIVAASVATFFIGVQRLSRRAMATAELSTAMREMREKLLFHAQPAGDGVVWSGLLSGVSRGSSPIEAGIKVLVDAPVFTLDGGAVSLGEIQLLNDSGRFNLYKAGLKVFLDNPIFGQTFYPAAGSMPEFSDVEAFSSFFPPRWHNTVVQMLASCGAVGMLAYSFHRLDTIIYYFKHRTVSNTFIAISILTLLGMSLLDCHFFNVAPVFFYSMALTVMEYGRERPVEN